MATCESHGHLYGYGGTCVMCKEPKPAPAAGAAALLAKHQPCGCVVCTCEDDLRCHGCGAWHCGTHPISEIPNAIYTQPAEGGEVTVTDVKQVFVWLLEGADEHGAVYCTPNYQWTKDANEACWFARQKDAELFGWNVEQNAKAVQHAFIG
jgi:hypothetical protein